MARTKQEVRDFLNSLVGLMVNEKCGIYNGQCVSLIKALFEFLGVPNPYMGRGNAKDAGDTYVRQGIAANSSGWLNVCVNRDMGVIDGVNYGHIWLDLAGEMNIEQNGARALRTTKNTRPISQAQQIVNLDQYIKGDTEMIIGSGDNYYARFNRFHHQLVRNGDLPREVFNTIIGQEWGKVLESWSDHPEANQLIEDQVLGELARKDGWQNQIYNGLARIATLEQERNTARDVVTALKAELLTKDAQIAELKAQLALTGDDTKNLNAFGELLKWFIKRLGISK